MEYQKVKLKNGLRIIAVPDKNAQTVTVLILVGAGSKYEAKETSGLSHFLEHMFFKGTKKRPNTLAISETLDKVGGAYNAFTSKEFTGYYAKVAKEHSELALDWVSDIFLNSKIEDKEVQREKGVIIEELNMYLDAPMKHIGDIWEELLYGDQPAGWPTIGFKQNILAFNKKHVTEYLKNYYSSQNIIVCLAGNFNKQKMTSQIDKNFKNVSSNKPKDKAEVLEKQTKPRVLVYPKKTDQTHLALGVRAYDLSDDRKYATGILATILGGNMSSRLFIKVREKSGLAYYVHTSFESYTDSGYIVTSAGVRNSDVVKASQLILGEYKSIRDKGITRAELQKAKDYLKGSMALALEPSDAQASFYASQELLTGKVLTQEEKNAKIDKVSISDVKKVAEDIFKLEKLNLALIGPHKNKKVFENILKF